MEISWGRAMWRNHPNQSPDWYKLALLVFLIINPFIFLANPFIAGWLLVAEFIFTGDGVKVLPLPGGLLAIEAVIIGMTSAAHVREEVAANTEVLLLLMFMVAGIYFMKQLLLFILPVCYSVSARRWFCRWPFASPPHSCRLSLTRLPSLRW